MHRPEGFLLLTLQNCKLTSSTGDPSDRIGTLSVVCVTLDVESQTSSSLATKDDSVRDVWLVLRLGDIEYPISPTQTILHSRSKSTYTFTAAGPLGELNSARVTLIVPPPTSAAEAEDTETLEVLLTQYAILQEIDADAPGSDGDLKGRLVLVDPEDGEYVGMLGGNVKIDEDPTVERDGKDPVVVEISEDNKNIRVHSVRADEDDYLLRSAEFLSRGIVFTANAIASGLNKASTAYVQHATPNPEPLVFSETTRNNVRRVHAFSGQAVEVTASTTGMIHNVIDKITTRLVGPSKKSTAPESPKNKTRLLNRLLLSTDMLISALEQSASTIISSGSRSLSAGVGHKYGKDAGDAAQLFGETAQNVSVIYIDARGVGRRALLKHVGKGVVKARLGNKDVVFEGSPPGASGSSQPVPGKSVS